MDTTAHLADALTTNDELAAYPGAPFSKLAVEVACAEVRGACHWHIGPAVEGIKYTLDLESSTDVLVLDTLHLTAVTAVTDERTGQPITGWRVSRAGMIQLPRRLDAGVAVVSVTATHGLDTIPLDLLAVIADRARTFDTEATRDPDLRTRTVGSVTYTWVNRGDSTNPDPLSRYAHVLRRYTV